MTDTVNLQINKDLGPGLLKGSTIELKAERGIPLNSFWRRRLKDAEMDNCVSVVKEVKPKKGDK